MTERKIVIEKKYHFGDNPEYSNFSDGTYIGLILSLPLHLESIDEQAESIKIFFETREIETFPGWEGHKVYINNQEIGNLKDSSPDSPELFEIELSRKFFETILAGSKNFELKIKLDDKRNSPGLWDDFMLTKIETEEAVFKIGWTANLTLMENISLPDFGGYELGTPFELPVAIQDALPVFDVLGDGRIISTDGAWVYVETNRGSRAFSQLKNLGGSYSAYIRVSPSEDRIAVDKSGTVVIFDVQTPDQELAYSLGGGFDAEWLDTVRLAITTASNGVMVLDTSTGDKKIAIQNIGGSPAGVTLDDNQTLFCGNGDDKQSGGSQTGWIKAFSKAAWEQAIVTNTPIDFEQNGILVADLLSSAYLGFDKDGNMYIGGGVVSGVSGDVGGSGEPPTPDLGYAALISAEALNEALNGGSPVTRESPPNKLHQFDPDPSPDSWYFLNANRVTGEFYLKLYSQNIKSVYVFQKRETN